MVQAGEQQGHSQAVPGALVDQGNVSSELPCCDPGML